MKKVLSLVLVIAMVLSSMSFAFAAKFEDIADIDYEEAIETLNALGVITGYEDGTFRPEKTVTRAEMAKLMVELLGYGDLVAGSKSNFTDTQGHWADQWIALAAGRGIVIGTGDGKFNPEGIVTYDQVLTMLVRGLGYTDASNELKNMTWPTNFKVKAAELNITKNVNMSSTQADRGGVAQAMFNALDQQLVKVNADGDIVKEYRVGNKDEQIPVRLISRIATPDYTFEVKFEHIDPDDKNYAGNKVDLTQYLFQTVEAYFSKNNSKEVVYVGDVESLTYKDDFDSIKEVDEKIKLTVGDYTFNVSGASVSYNNDEVKLSELDEDNLDGAKITVILDPAVTRVRDDEKAVGLIVEKVSTYVQVEEEYKADATEIDEIYLPVKDKKVDSKNLIIKGDATELADIEEDDIVAAYAPLGDDPTIEATDKLTLVVTRKTVEGEITGTKGSGYYIDRVEYKVNKGLDIDTLERGDEGTFFLDQYGKIIAFRGESEGSKTYAVVYDDVIDGKYRYSESRKSYTVTTAPEVKLATAANEKITYKFDIEINDDGTIEGDFAKLFKRVAPDKIVFDPEDEDADDFYGKLVSYSLNKDNEITKFATVGREIEMKTNSASFVLASNAVIFNKDGKVISEDDLGSTVEGTAAYQNGKIVALLTDIIEKGNEYYAYITAVDDDRDDNKNDVQRLTAFIKGAKDTKLFTDDDDTVKGYDKEKPLYLVEVNDKGKVIKATNANSQLSGVVTASAIDTKEGTITIEGKGKLFFDEGAGTIVGFDDDGDAKLVNKLSAIKKGETEFKYVLYKDADGDTKTIGYIILEK